ncbi:class I SAM-dependent methyltransferase [Tropicimonas aquimaris]|uniref:Class I SAM-dependent methyltransferase n=1 Tax=Tropicimonas aquimaris TaxID=914152 RepID=A0ABW3IMI2_9RHOB
MGKRSRFWDLIARRYARMPVRDEESYREKLAITRSYLQPDWDVLEIGCGTGTTALGHAPHVRRFRAVDSSPKMIEICREKAAAAPTENIAFDCADFDEIDQPVGSLDAVLAMSILHLLEDPDAALARIHAMLRPGGMFFSSTTCIADIDNAIARYLLPAAAALRLVPRMTQLGRAELHRRIEAAGFEVLRDWQPGDDPAKAVFIVARKPAP